MSYITKNFNLLFHPGILESTGADAGLVAAALKKSNARKKRGGVVGGSLPSVGVDLEDPQDIIVKDEEPSGALIPTPGEISVISH